MLKYILLGFLNYQPMTGYDLKTVIDHSTQHFWHAHHSQIYITLRKLEEDGLLTSEVEDENDRLNRRIYTITSAGQQELSDWLDMPLTEIVPVKEELLVRLFFSAQRPRAEVLDELRLQRRLHQQKLDYYRALRPSALLNRAAQSSSDEVIFWTATLRFGINFEQMYLQWLDKVIATLES
jgi:DNA-binding PadR family transcriptional regulator